MKISALLLLLLGVALQLASVSSNTITPNHFLITTPSKISPWVQGAPNALIWETAIEGIVMFDVELLRLSAKGLLLVAKNVPVLGNKAVVDVEGIPEGDDYFVVFMDSYTGQVYSKSSKFSVQSNNTASTTITASLTMTVTGSPHPTRAFETTLEPPAGATAVTGNSFYGVTTVKASSALGRRASTLSALSVGVLGGAVALLL